MTATRKVEAWVEPVAGVKKHEKMTMSQAVHFGLDGNVQEITAAAAIDLNANHVKITGPASSTYAITLAAPRRAGQIMVIEMLSTTSTNAVTLALTNVSGGSAATTATFNAAAETLTLVSANSKWIVLDELGVTLA